MTLLNKYKGCLVGLAVGDAVGTTNEFKPRNECDKDPLTDMIGGGPFFLNPGEWTDDTSMALCLAQSLIESGGFDMTNQLFKYLSWFRDGYMSSTGKCFDIGYQISQSLKYFEQTLDKWLAGYAGRRGDGTVSAGNGSLMRLAPIPMFYYPDRQKTRIYAGASSLTTHANPLCVDVCQIFSQMICDAFDGLDKHVICANSAIYYLIGSGLTKSRDELKSSGYVLESFEAAVWCFKHTNSFEEAILMAANLGDDTDTIAAICGQLAGAYYGLDGIPEKWVDLIVMSKEIQQMAQILYNYSKENQGEN